MIYTIYPCPVSFCPLDSFYPHIILPPPPGNLWMYTIYPCPVSFCPLEIVSWFTLFTHVPYHFAPWIHFAPYHFAPWKWFDDLHFLLMSRIILPLHWLLFHKKPFTTKAYDRRASGDCGTSGHTNKKPFTTKAYDRRASGDCGTSGTDSSYTVSQGYGREFKKSLFSDIIP